MPSFEGHCLCGSVRFSVRQPTIFCAHCHCRFCRMAHGAAFVTWVGVPEQQFTLAAGTELLSWYQSSIQSRRGFCSKCGSTMFYTSNVSPGEIHIARPYIDGDIGHDPEAHVFFDQRVHWITVSDSLPRITSDSTVLEKYKDV